MTSHHRAPALSDARGADRQYLAHIERGALRSSLPRTHDLADFADPPHRILVDVYRPLRRGSVAPLELAALLAQHARLGATAKGLADPLAARQLPDHLARPVTAATNLAVTTDAVTAFLSAQPWEPTWFDPGGSRRIEHSSAASAGPGLHQRDQRANGWTHAS